MFSLKDDSDSGAEKFRVRPRSSRNSTSRYSYKVGSQIIGGLSLIGVAISTIFCFYIIKHMKLVSSETPPTTPEAGDGIQVKRVSRGNSCQVDKELFSNSREILESSIL